MTTALGPFRVSAKADEVAAFRKAIRSGEDGADLPLTYPIRWLVARDVRDALTSLVPEPDIVPVHEAQTFDYQRPLRPDEEYVITLSARREQAPDRLIADGVIVDSDGKQCASVEVVLRLFSTKAAAA
jgi:hypothetical protein